MTNEERILDLEKRVERLEAVVKGLSSRDAAIRAADEGLVKFYKATSLSQDHEITR